MSDLAQRLVQEWASDRLTQPTPAELDLARWIVELIGDGPELGLAEAAFNRYQTERGLAGPLAALTSWTGEPDA